MRLTKLAAFGTQHFFLKRTKPRKLGTVVVPTRAVTRPSFDGSYAPHGAAEKPLVRVPSFFFRKAHKATGAPVTQLRALPGGARGVVLSDYPRRPFHVVVRRWHVLLGCLAQALNVLRALNVGRRLVRLVAARIVIRKESPQSGFESLVSLHSGDGSGIGLLAHWALFGLGSAAARLAVRGVAAPREKERAIGQQPTHTAGDALPNALERVGFVHLSEHLLGCDSQSAQSCIYARRWCAVAKRSNGPR